MRIKIDLKIFLFLILFYFTKQIGIYTTIIIFAIIHELGHLIAGLLVGMKPDKMELKPYGVSISFKISKKETSIKGHIKKIFVATAGPLTNLLVIIVANNMKLDLFSNLIIIYANILLIVFNLIPIYPLDGGRILKEILHICYGEKKAIRYISNISFIILIILTFTGSIAVYYLENIAIFIIIIFLWGIYINQDIIEKRRNKIQDLIEKTIEINDNS